MDENKFVPQKDLFNEAENLQKNRNILLLMSSFLSIIATFILPIMKKYVNLDDQIGWMINVIIVLVLVAVFVLEQKFDSVYQSAELIRRKSFVDNAFGTKMLTKSSAGYYDNEESAAGIKRALANLHQSAFETGEILNRMSPHQEKVNGIASIVLVLIAIIFSARNSLLIFALQMVLSKQFFGAFFDFKRLKNDIKVVQDECIELWNKLDVVKEEISLNMYGDVFAVVLKYETALSYASMMLDSRIYRQWRDELDKQWVEIQNRYGIIR